MLLIFLAMVSLAVISSDIKHRKIPNITVVFTGALTSIIALTGPQQQLQLLLPAAIIAVGAILMLLNILGAGDSKLLAAYALGIKPALFPGVLLLIALIGGATAVGMLLTNRQRARERGVPYGPAVAVSGCLGVMLSNLG